MSAQDLTIPAREVMSFDIIEGRGRVRSADYDYSSGDITFRVGTATHESRGHLGGTVTYPVWSDMDELVVRPYKVLNVRRNEEIA